MATQAFLGLWRAGAPLLLSVQAALCDGFLVAERWAGGHGLQELWLPGPVSTVSQLWRRLGWSAAAGVFPDQGSNSRLLCIDRWISLAGSP